MMLKTTTLFEEHKKRGAKITSFAGWRLPLEFSNAREEHLHVRKHIGLFDVSHMGEIHIQGPEALCFLSRLVTNQISNLKEGQCQYNLLCNSQGGIIDDLIVYCLEFKKNYLLCVNAGNIEKDFQWITQQSRSHSYSVQITDESPIWGQLALQGPKTEKLAQRIFGSSVLNIKKFHFNFLNFNNERHLVSRTGYTGEDGFEILSPTSSIKKLWHTCLNFDLQVLPIGLAARDTLRLEMKYPLSGQDMNENTNPIEMGLKWACANSTDFIGKEQILKTKKCKKKWIGFEMQEPSGIPRTGYAIYSLKNEHIGKVTSGALSPSLNKIIGLAFIQNFFSKNQFFIDIHSKKTLAQVASTPFIQKNKIYSPR